jgi:HK97 family phage portal protein
MGIFSRAIERRSGETTLLSNPEGWLYEAFGISPTDSGVSVGERQALKYSAVYSCVNVIAQSIAQVPWNVCRRSDDGKKQEIARDRAEHYLLHSEPIGTMSSYSFRVAFMANCLLHGNTYIEIVRDGANRVTAFRLIPSTRVMVFESLDQSRLVYQVTRLDGQIDTLDGSDMVHIPCLSLDGIAGLSPIAQHRQAVGLGLAAEAAGAAFFGNGSRPSGYLYSKSRLDEKSKADLEDRWKKYTGPRSTGKVPILTGDLSWQQLSINPVDAQYLETRVFQISEIARIFRVPAVLIGLADKTSTYASADAFFLAFVKFTLAPWVMAIEQEFDRKVFPNTNKLYCKFDLNGLLRGDPKTRAEFYKTLWSTGAFSSNDILDWEEMDPIAGGDRHFVQQGFMPLDKVDEVLAKQGNKPAPAAGQDQQDQARSAHLAWLNEVVGRVGKWEKRDRAKVAEAFYPVFQSLEGRSARDTMPFCLELADSFNPSDTNFALTAIRQFEDSK